MVINVTEDELDIINAGLTCMIDNIFEELEDFKIKSHVDFGSSIDKTVGDLSEMIGYLEMLREDIKKAKDLRERFYKVSFTTKSEVQ